MSIAFVFPGQGSQSPGMGRDLRDRFELAAAAFDEADAALDSPISAACFEGSAEDLALTETTQPAILTCSIAAWRVLDGAGIRPSFVAGHSLGEWSALVATGSLGLGPAVATVRNRGRYMQEAVPVGEGAMAALLGLDREQVEAACLEQRQEGEILQPANFNSAGQVVVAGHAVAVDRLLEAGAGGARRAVRLQVSAPFHCPLMQPAADRLAADLEALELGPMSCPLVANVDAEPRQDPEAERQALLAQVTAPVRWEDTVRTLVAAGVDTVVEVGPGKVLAGLVKKTDRSLKVLSAGDAASVEQVLETLG
ncbi:MAG: ACP S-malonyltransferase [Acidobacteriota bacterium]